PGRGLERASCLGLCPEPCPPGCWDIDAGSSSASQRGRAVCAGQLASCSGGPCHSTGPAALGVQGKGQLGKVWPPRCHLPACHGLSTRRLSPRLDA
uniref:Uncharacterized protein n=1 Tax=Calidris pygmaea TaxID=425635 RepID=A0A8C3J9Y4_9CHAR